MTTLKTQKIEIGQITNGPSKFDLMLSLFNGSSSEGTHAPVKFTVKHKTLGEIVLEVMVQGVSREDGSGESWNITGFVSGPEALRRKLFSLELTIKLDIYFSTRNRSGFAKQVSETRS